MKNKEYIKKEILKSIKNIENDLGIEEGKLEFHFEYALSQLDKNF